MGIMTRVLTLFKADIHGVMDRLENRELLLKNHLREMEEILENNEKELKRKASARERIRQRREQYGKQKEKLEQNLTLAVRKNKDDIAQVLIKKARPLAELCENLNRTLEKIDEKIASDNEALVLQRLRTEQIKHRSQTYFQTSGNHPPFLKRGAET